MAGAPTTYTPEIAAALCERITRGENVRDICRDPAMPGFTTICGWRLRHPEFADLYARAREASAEALEMQALAEALAAHDGESAQVARIRVDTLKWAAAKRQPRVYSDRTQNETNLGVVIQIASPISRVPDEGRDGLLITADNK